ncbi:MAG TPA: ferredoxin reductase family protein [Anaerolineae bacterium]|nr:ferredoxin reductase family protein [Anaerolineae bacterium]
MVFIARGIIWYGLYLFLILLPLATAIIASPNRVDPPFLSALGIAAGFIGFSLMALEFSLISRIESAAEPFGEDSLQLFHNIMGVTALGFILAHPILLIVSGYPASCWLNPFSACANTATIFAALSILALLLLIITSLWRKQLRIRYEFWYAAHGLLALFIVFAALVHIFVLGRYTSAPIMKAVWILYAVLVLGLIIWYKIWTPIRNWQRKWQIVENKVERGDSRTLAVEPQGHSGFEFKPGQFAWLKTGRTPFGIGQHPISISSSSEEPPNGRVTFTIKDLGDWSGKEVPALNPGDTIWLDGPHGVFSIDRLEAMGYIFVAGGVGITPLFAMCQTMADREDVRPVLLFYGGADLESLTFHEELEALQERMNMKLIPVLSNPADDWTGERGYITQEILSRYLPKQYKRYKYLICGPKPLMDAMEEALPDLGVPRQNVLTERFDMV